MKKISVLSIFNKLDTTIIPLENFINLDDQIEKYILVLDQNKNLAQKEISKLYPNKKIYLIAFQGLGIWRIIQLLKNKISVVHTHHTKSALLGLILKIIFQIYLIHTVHNNFLVGYNKIQKIIFRLIFLFADRLIANSLETFKSLPSFINKNKKVIIHNSIDDIKLAKYSNDLGKINIKKRKLVFGTVCRLVDFKNIPLIVKSFEKIIFIHKIDASLIIIGAGPLETKLKNLVNMLNLSDRVEFTGLLNRDNVYERVRGFDVFVVSSLYEGFCNAMVEAAAIGVPLIVSNIPTLREVLGGFQNASFFESNNLDELTNLMRFFSSAENYEMINKKAINAKKYVLKNYSKKRVSELYKNQYFELYFRNAKFKNE